MQYGAGPFPGAGADGGKRVLFGLGAFGIAGAAVALLGAGAIGRLGSGDAELERVGLAVMLEGELGDGKLLLDVLDLGGSDTRARQPVPEGLDLVFEVDDVRVQGMSHGRGEKVLQRKYLTGKGAGARGIETMRSRDAGI